MLEKGNSPLSIRVAHLAPEVAKSFDRGVEDHSGAGESHDGTHLLLSIAAVAVRRALLAGWLLFAPSTSVESVMGVLYQLLAFGA